MEVPFQNLTERSDNELENLKRVTLSHGTLEDVLKWARSLPGYGGKEEFVTQDEFTHDAVFPYEQGLDVVYGLT